MPRDVAVCRARDGPARAEGRSSTGRAPVSKTGGWGFKSLRPCEPVGRVTGRTVSGNRQATDVDVNRQLKRMQAREDRRAEKQPKTTQQQRRAQATAPTREKVGARQFGREVVAEMRKVLWPTRQQVVTSSIVVLIVVLVMVAYVYGLDTALGEVVKAVYSR